MTKYLLWRVCHRIRYDDPSGCWIYTGYIRPAGYGQVAQNTILHRYMFEQVYGPIPPGKQLDHICRVRACCNPEHLEPVDIATNVLRGEGWAAKKAAQTHCDQGHELTPENTYHAPKKPDRRRECRICRRERNKQFIAKQSPEWREERREYVRQWRARKRLEKLEADAKRSAPPQ